MLHDSERLVKQLCQIFTYACTLISHQQPHFLFVFLTVTEAQERCLLLLPLSKQFSEVVISVGKWVGTWGNVLCSGFLDSINIFGRQGSARVGTPEFGLL